MTGQPHILHLMRPLPKSREQERIQKPHARQPQPQRRRGGEEQQEGYVVEIPVPDGSADEAVQV